MVKTLTATVGPGLDMPATNLRLTVDGTAPDDVQAIWLDMDASTMRPVSFTLRHLRIIDGLPFTADETHAVRSLSITIKYEEGE